MAENLPFTQSPADPQLKDVLDALKKDIFLSLLCHHVGTVQAFNATNQTATVTINYKKTYYRLSPATGLYSPVLKDYPVLIDCPAIVLGGGAAALTFPIQEGDECLVLFNDRDFDTWFSGGTGTGNATPRLHSFADAIVLVGLRSLGNVLADYDLDRAVLRNLDAYVGVNTSRVKIGTADLGSLGPNFAVFFTALSAFMAACAGSADATLSAAATAFTTAMTVPVAPAPTGALTNIEGILE